MAKKSIILSIILLTGFLFFGIINKNMQNNNTYQLKNKTYYEVTLKPNNYFSSNTIDADKYYIAASIKSVDIYFDYYLKNKTKDNINYSYDITATLKSYADNGTKLILTKDFNLKNMNNLKQKEIKINEKYNLDYEYYANYVKSFERYYNIKTETYLDIKLNIKINDKDKDNSYVLLTIPINESIVEITMKEDNNFLENNVQNNQLNKIIFFIIIIIVLLISKILFHKDNDDDILKEYQDLIIVIQNKPNINSNNIICLSNLKDLISITINNNINIFNYHNIYYTIIDSTYYIYIKEYKGDTRK